MNRPRLNELDVEQVAILTKNGWTAKEISGYLDRDATTIRRHQIRLGLRVKQVRDPERLRERVADLTAAGLTAAVIADRIGCSQRHVVRLRTATRTEPLPAPVESSADWELAARLVEDRCPRTEVARTIGVSEAVVARRFPDHKFHHADGVLFARALRELDKAKLR